jgi:hypothetical protein
MKLRQNGIVSLLIRLAAFQASGGARVKLHCKSFFFDQTGRSRPEVALNPEPLNP